MLLSGRAELTIALWWGAGSIFWHMCVKEGVVYVACGVDVGRVDPTVTHAGLERTL